MQELTKEMEMIGKLYGNAPIIIIGDFQETITPSIDNITMMGRKLRKEQGVLQLL